MLKSDKIDEIAQALCKAQNQMDPAHKSGLNPLLHNRYSTLDDVLDAIREPFFDNGLAFTQALDTDENGVYLETVIMHTSGQYIGSRLVVQAVQGNRGVNEMQTFGIALTYSKRYALASLAGVAQEDDTDGNGATASNPARRGAQQSKPAEKRQTATTPPPPDDEYQQDNDNDTHETTQNAIQCVAVGIHSTSKGKRRIGFLANGEKYPRVHTWSASDAALIVPEIAYLYSHEVFENAEDGKMFPFYCTLYHDGAQYPAPVRAEFNDGDMTEFVKLLTSWAVASDAELDDPEPTWEWIAASVAKIREARK